MVSWIFQKVRKTLQMKTPATVGHSSPGRASRLAGGDWLLGCSRCGICPESSPQRLRSADFSPRLSGNLSGSLRPLLPLPPGAAAPPGGRYGMDEPLGLPVDADPGCRSGLRTCQALHLPFDPLYPHDPAGRQGHRGHPGFRPGDQGYRGKMFLADLLIYGSWALVLLLLLGLAQIRFLHVPFCVLLALAAVLGAALTPWWPVLPRLASMTRSSIAWPIRPTAPGTRLLHPLLTSHQPPVSSPKAQQAPTCNTAPSVAKRRPNPPGSATTAAPSWTAPHCNNQFGCQIKPAEQTFHLLSGF